MCLQAFVAASSSCCILRVLADVVPGRILREKIRQLEMTLSDAQRALSDDSAAVADYRTCADNLKENIAKERNREKRQALAGKLEAVEEQQLEASAKEAASDSRVRKLKTELFNLQHSRFLVVSSLDALTLPPPVAITISREKLAIAVDVEPSLPGVTGIKTVRPHPVSAQLCTLCRYRSSLASPAPLLIPRFRFVHSLTAGCP
jgi:hypothetical protein